MANSDAGRRWWLQTYGVPPWRLRRLRDRWPDWDHLTPIERAQRERVAFRAAMARHTKLLTALLLLLALTAVSQLIGALGEISRRPAAAIYNLTLSVVAGAAIILCGRELRRGRGGS